MPIEDILGADLTFYIIAYDENGNERKEVIDKSERFMSEAVIEKLRKEPVTYPFIMSHGWKGDMPAARDQHQRWISAMAVNTVERTSFGVTTGSAPAGFAILFWDQCVLNNANPAGIEPFPPPHPVDRIPLQIHWLSPIRSTSRSGCRLS